MLNSVVNQSLYPQRFNLYLISQITILFGSLVIPVQIFDAKVLPIVLLFNLLCGILVISKKKGLSRIFLGLFIFFIILFGFSYMRPIYEFTEVDYLRLGTYFIFQIIVAYQIVKQIWLIDKVNQNVIIGLISGYLCIGLIGFFMFLMIELITPGSLGGMGITQVTEGKTLDSILYYSFITLMTIGYGEIYPLSSVAQKASILLGLIGQFYLVIITAVVIEKYIRHRKGS